MARSDDPRMTASGHTRWRTVATGDAGCCAACRLDIRGGDEYVRYAQGFCGPYAAGPAPEPQHVDCAWPQGPDGPRRDVAQEQAREREAWRRREVIQDYCSALDWLANPRAPHSDTWDASAVRRRDAVRAAARTDAELAALVALEDARRQGDGPSGV